MRGARVRNFYKVLGIAATADDGRIKTAFRRRAKAVHPDLNPGKQRAQARFIELMQAYEVLSDAKNRAAYDAYLAERRSQARRRLLHCAGLMMTSFALTTASAILVMSIAGANVPLRETWQLAVAALSPANAKASAAEQGGAGWTTRVAVAPVPGSPSDNSAPADSAKPAPAAKPSRRAKVNAHPAPAPSKVPVAKSRDTGEPLQHVATAPKHASPAGTRPEPPPSSAPDGSWPPSPPADEPRYSLGASDLR
jgi:curved DNA-binding protein CbpA